MLKIAWVTDSTACLDEELRSRSDVFVIPMTILLDGEEYHDQVDLTAEELYAKLKDLQSPPKTSQPSIGAFVKVYEQLQDHYDHVISILVSKKLSGTVSSSEQAAQLVSLPVTTIDSEILSYPLTRLIKLGISLASSGKNATEIEEIIKHVASSSETFVLVGSLEQLHRSGRMSGLQFFLGSMLKVKPIISVEAGALVAKDKVRSVPKAKEKIISYLEKTLEQHNIREAYLLYGLHDRDAKEWQEELCKRFPDIQFSHYPLGATIGVHAGENTLGISWFKALKEEH